MGMGIEGTWSCLVLGCDRGLKVGPMEPETHPRIICIGEREETKFAGFRKNYRPRQHQDVESERSCSQGWWKAGSQCRPVPDIKGGNVDYKHGHKKDGKDNDKEGGNDDDKDVDKEDDKDVDQEHWNGNEEINTSSSSLAPGISSEKFKWLRWPDLEIRIWKFWCAFISVFSSFLIRFSTTCPTLFAPWP